MGIKFGGIESGGTKFVCAIGSGPDDLTEVKIIPTGKPDETISEVIEFFDPFNSNDSLEAIGISSFGPLDLDHDSATHGYIKATPHRETAKKDWVEIDLLGPIKRAINIPITLDTDVNGAAIGEHRWGAGNGYDNLIYITVGTGVGGGAIVNGRIAHGLIHPEMGHMRVPHDWKADPFPGRCPFHGDCVQGLANAPAIEERWGARCDELPDDHPAWDLEAYYLSLMVSNLVFSLSPEILILGGGVMQRNQLITKIQANVSKFLGGYVQSDRVINNIDSFVVLPGLGSMSGVLGGIAMAQDLVRD